MEITALNGPTEDIKWEDIKWETNVVPLPRDVIVNAAKHGAERVCTFEIAGVNGAECWECYAPMCDQGAYWTVYLEYARDVTVTGRFTCDNDKLLTLEPVVRWMVPP